MQMVDEATTHHVYGTRLKNLMEQFIQQQIKDRTDECFDDYFPCRKKENCDKQHVWNWLKKMFLVYHNMSLLTGYSL
jgi:hypothetical protein